jgi:hypothetical protein
MRSGITDYNDPVNLRAPVRKELNNATCKAGCLAISVLLVLLSLWLMFSTRDTYATIAAQTWEARQEIEAMQTMQDSCWCPAPASAYHISRSQRQHGTRQVADGEDCNQVCNQVCTNTDNGDGTYSQECQESCHPGTRRQV